MQIDAFMHPRNKSRKGRGDDTILVMPGLLGVFDGATDPLGSKLSEKSSGLYASEAVATGAAQMFSNGQNFDMLGDELVLQLSGKISAGASHSGYKNVPATTIAMAMFKGDRVRLVIAGDSGIRINGKDVHQPLKEIDTVSAAARIAVFRILRDRGSNLDEVELASRRAIFQGLDTCIGDGILGATEVADIVRLVCETYTHVARPDILEMFVRAGIKSQAAYGNDDHHPLGYSAIDGTRPSMRDIIDLTLDINEVQSLEIFSDGYFEFPEMVTIEAWESKFQETENDDFHKIDKYANVKGSTSEEFSDDRSIIIATMAD